jgi:dCMP deaminase
MQRPSWDEYFMNVAHAVKARADCTRRQVGAILVKGKQIISTGYNGTPRGLKNCSEGGCERCNSDESQHPRGKDLDKCACSHAEENTIVQAALHGMSTDGATLYTTDSPCTICAKMIINAGIKKIVAGGEYPDDLGTELLKEAGIELVKFRKK